MANYTQSFKNRVATHYNRHQNFVGTGRKFNVSTPTIRRWVSDFNTTTRTPKTSKNTINRNLSTWPGIRVGKNLVTIDKRTFTRLQQVFTSLVKRAA